jgi:hypothetical protein
MNNLDFFRLSKSGGYSLPVLIEMVHPDLASWYFTNDSRDIYWNGHLYQAAALGYKPPGSRDGVPLGGALEIDPDIQDGERNELLKWFDLADDRAKIKATAIVNEDGSIKPLGEFKHQYGKASWDGRKIIWNAGGDDRFEMQINPWTFDRDSLTG